MTRFAICGLGSIGRRHMRNLMTLGEGDIILVRSGQSTLPDSELPDLPVEHDLCEALERWQPDAVIVATPTALHLDSAIPAARAGCHILLEKPVSDALDRIDELQAAVALSGSRVLVGFQFRFHPGLRVARSLVQSGALGRAVSARAHWGEYLPAWHPWEDYRLSYSARADLGGGVVLTLCHPLDYLPWILGEASRVCAQVGQLGGLGVEVEDQAEIGLRFESGAMGSVHLDYIQRPPRHRVEVIGTEGWLEWDGLEGWVRTHHEAGERSECISPPAGFERNDMFLEEIRHFVAVARGEVEPCCSLDEGVRALRLALAALRSSKDGAVVDLRAEER